MKLVSKFIVYGTLSDKTYLLLGLQSPLMNLVLMLNVLTSSTFIITNEILNEYLPFVDLIYFYFQSVTSSLSISQNMYTIIRV